ncbi:MAG: NFYB/HAP3 family transcription factor subunit [Candidatus Aenigmarchaeota archaeon]|nr:NFYB/HAP3 family transcription factor subunit [Candidatus Aenigmarchaeota archaeon]
MVREFPLAPLEKIAKKAGAKRVSDAAVKALKDAVLEYAYKIASDAVMISRHAGRVTIKESDIKLAAKRLKL